MKKIILLILFVFVIHFNNVAQVLDTEIKQYDYWGNTHVHCVNEASKLLFYDLGYNYLDILNNLDYIRSGDLQEDLTDLVYGYEGITGDGITVTHFWDADCGWETKNNFYWKWIVPLYLNVPNAYTKVQRYVDGNYYLNATDNNNIAHRFKYTSNTNGLDGLIDYYKNGHVFCTNHDCWEDHSQEVRTIFTYKLLGHMCHLLQDMSVPAHSRIEIHNPDCFEIECGTGLLPTYLAAGNLFDPFIFDDPIKGLFYSANQIADIYVPV